MDDHPPSRTAPGRAHLLVTRAYLEEGMDAGRLEDARARVARREARYLGARAR